MIYELRDRDRKCEPLTELVSNDEKKKEKEISSKVPSYSRTLCSQKRIF